ncbi:hypothetical protein Pa4123_58870 [Phytohabitans aurantiacus]|uniref:Uncharacterized protein n=2 Tax=Phytohabitans aurantiacus TaxID=3016789 RepID=A0ABQ5R223_9ACTN|nr:hypothetical protein Pa4123_58870 [Phytohabitans aurantiacus]
MPAAQGSSPDIASLECHSGQMRINSRALDRFDVVSWQRIAERVSEWTAPHSPVMAEIVASIQASAVDQMAGFMSMHDLAVTTTPVPDIGPIDVIWIRPQPSNGPDSQQVLIEHCPATGWDDRIMRPAPEAVSLFWRFAREKWGIEPARGRASKQ